MSQRIKNADSDRPHRAGDKMRKVYPGIIRATGGRFARA